MRIHTLVRSVSLVGICALASALGGCAIDGTSQNASEDVGTMNEALSTAVAASASAWGMCNQGKFDVVVRMTGDANDTFNVSYVPNGGAAKHIYSGPPTRWVFVATRSGKVVISGAVSKSVAIAAETCAGDFSGSGSGPEEPGEIEHRDEDEQPGVGEDGQTTGPVHGGSGPGGNQRPPHGAEP